MFLKVGFICHHLFLLSYFQRPKEKKHVIEIRRDVKMPSLPEIELPEIQRIYRPLHFSGIDDDIELSQRKKGIVIFHLLIKLSFS